MQQRIDYVKVAPGAVHAMLGLERYLHSGGLGEPLIHLIKLRASQRERAALAWTEAVTRITEGHVADQLYERVRRHFSEKELVDLTLAVATINAWNRLSISMRTEPGTYHPKPAQTQSRTQSA